MNKHMLLKELLSVSRLEPVAQTGEPEETDSLFPDEPVTPEAPEASGTDSLRPDGTSDGLDAFIHGYFDEFGLDGEESEYDPSAELNAADVGSDLGDIEDPEAAMAGLGDEPVEGEPAPFGDEETMPFGDEEPAAGEDPNFQGTIRTVKGACLVYKRKDESGTFEELWIYNVGKGYGSDQSMRIRKSILSGTDIEETGTQSEDGSQEASSYSIGNVQYLQLRGLPN